MKTQPKTFIHIFLQDEQYHGYKSLDEKQKEDLDRIEDIELQNLHI